MLVSLAPLVYDAVRAIQHRWVPYGDDAFVAFRVEDVFGRYTPLIGMPAVGLGASSSAATLHHLGPLEFWMLAVPYRAFGSSSNGIILGVLLIAASTIVGIGVVARRLGGTVFGVAALLLATSMVWSFGAQLAHRPFNPSVAVLPLLLLMLLATALARGDVALWPAFAIVSSFVAQAHLTYVPVVAALTAWVLIVSLRAFVSGRAEPLGRGRRCSRRVVLVTAGVLALCWAGPVLQQLLGNSGNLSNLRQGLSGSQTPVTGLRFGSAVVGDVVATPWGLANHPTTVTVPLDWSWATVAVRYSVAIITIAVLVVIGVRRRLPHLALTAGTAAVSVVAAVLTLSRAPQNALPFGGTTGWYTWLLWPVAAGFWLLMLLGLLSCVELRRSTSLALGLLLLFPLAGTANLARGDRSAGADADARQRAIADIVAAVHRSLPRSHSVRVIGGRWEANEVLAGVVFDLTTTGPRPFVDTRDPVLRYSFDHPQLYHGERVDGTVYIQLAAYAQDTRLPRLVRTRQTTKAERGERAANERQLRDAYSAGSLILNEEGRMAFQNEQAFVPTSQKLTPERFFEERLADGSVPSLYRSRTGARRQRTELLLSRAGALRKKMLSLNPAYDLDVWYVRSAKRGC